jgi:hypothetical protein
VAEIYFDHNVVAAAAGPLRQMGHSVRTASNIGMARASDDEHFLLAAQRGWLTITSNGRDFILLHDAWHRWSAAWGVAPPPVHGGVLVVDARWLVPRLVGEIVAFLGLNLPTPNHLYTHHPARGWAPYP